MQKYFSFKFINLLCLMLALLISLKVSEWGLPSGIQSEAVHSWAYDEFNPLYAAKVTMNTLQRKVEPEKPYLYFYPPAYSFLLTAWNLPVWVGLYLTGNWNPHEASQGFPFGLKNPSQSIPFLTWWGRLSSVVLLFFIGIFLWRVNPEIAGILVLSPYVLYYSGTNNVDFVAFVFCAIAIYWGWIKERWKNAVIFAALAAAVKDQFWATAFIIPFVATGFPLRVKASWFSFFKLSLFCALAYAIAQLLPWSWPTFIAHVHAIVSNPTGEYYLYSKTFFGGLQLLQETIKNWFLGVGPGVVLIVLFSLRELRKPISSSVLVFAHFFLVIWVVSYVYLRFMAPWIALTLVQCMGLVALKKTNFGKPVLITAIVLQLLGAVELLSQVVGDVRPEVAQLIESQSDSAPLHIVSIQSGDRSPFPKKIFDWISLPMKFTAQDLAQIPVKENTWIVITSPDFRENVDKKFSLKTLEAFCLEHCTEPLRHYESRSLFGRINIVQPLSPDVWVAQLKTQH